MEILKIVSSGNVKKAVFRLDDGYTIETSFEYPFWICLSTQVGCPNNCKFCMSGSNGFIRNLSSKEMLMQIQACIEYSIEKYIPQKGFFQISFSGMGEPLYNAPEVFKCIEILQTQANVDICITTSGIVSELQKYITTIPKKIGLDISVHSFISKKRASIMPIENIFPICDVLDEVLQLSEYFKWIHIDYMMLKDFNDSDEDLNIMIETLREKSLSVELKKYNRSSINDHFEGSDDSTLKKFSLKLNHSGIYTYIEENVGLEIGAGCGQLLWDYKNTLE